MSDSRVPTTIVLTTLLGATSSAFGQAVLMDQIGADNGSSIDTDNFVASQIFEAALSIYDIAAVDDFETTANTLTTFHAVITGWNGYVNIDGVSALSLNIYSTPEAAGTSLVGDLASVYQPGAPETSSEWTLPSYDLVVLEATVFSSQITNWISLIPHNEFGTNGQTGCATSTLGDYNAYKCNPGGGFGFGATQQLPNNFAYRVLGLSTDDCNDNGIVDSDEIAADPTLDCDNNGILDECQIAEGFDDCNDNQILDSCEIADGTSTDCDGNGTPDECDVANGLDCNGNGVPDDCDLADGTSNDCNGNGWLDDCETEEGNDCNENGVPDDCDIADGTSTDCDGNSTPDECDVANGLDCNGNGVPDECDDITDCNNNGIEDSCDIADGTSQDLDGDGVPDECPFDCSSYFLNGLLQQQDGDYQRSTAAFIDVGHGLVAVSGARVNPGFWSEFDLLLYDSDSLELTAVVPTRVPYSQAVPVYGSSIAIAEDFIVFSNRYGDASNPVSVAERINGNWIQTEIIPAPFGTDNFGYSVAAANNYIAVCNSGNNSGTPGVVYLYRRAGSANWTLQQIIEGPAGSSDWWGLSLEMDGEWLAIGEPYYGNDIYMYRFDGSSYLYHSMIEQEVPGPGYFGSHMSMDGGVLVCGNTDILNGPYTQSVELHRWNGDTWVFEAELSADEANAPELFGASVSIQGNRVAVGAPQYYSSTPSVGAYVFERRTDGTWHKVVRVEDPNSDSTDLFAFSCAVTSDALIVGEPWNDLPSAYSYTTNTVLDPDDCNSNGICDGLDIAAGGGTDCDGSGVLDQCEIEEGLLDDIDLNGIPDLCELDCDGDGLPDAYELASGFGFDCNVNGQLDNCDIASGQSPDGDGDGVPDECDPGFVITVAADGSGMFSDLQAAIDLSIPGSRIEVQPGVYPGSITFPGHDIELVSVGSAQDTIIDAQGTGRAIFIGDEHSSATLLDGFTLQNGSVDHPGGGLLILRSTPTIHNCVIRDCEARNGGGVAVYDTPNGDARCAFYNTIIENNHATGEDFEYEDNGGGGMFCLNARMHLVECLIKGNTAMRWEGGIQAVDNDFYDQNPAFDLLLQQCEISSNTGLPGYGVLSFGSNSVVQAEDTLICGNAPANGVQVMGDYIDLGWNLFWDDCSDCNANGIDDVQEILDGNVTDVDNDGIPDECETDCDGDGTPDPIELYLGEANDVDDDGHPDNCEPDCNQNTIPDDYEIEQGWAEDCNDNLVPDGCDLKDAELDCNADGLIDACQVPDESIDCDGNDLIDTCEILSDPSLDCNGSGTIDSCDVDSGSSNDTNGNGIPDDCECLADIDESGSVDINDLLLVISQWDLANGSGDMNSDGIVDTNDLLFVLSSWGPCP